MEIIALAILLASSATYFMYQLGLVRSRLVKLEERAGAPAEPNAKALNASQEAIVASNAAREVSQKALEASQRATEASQRAVDTSTATASRLRSLPTAAPDLEPSLNAMRDLIDRKIGDLAMQVINLEAQVAVNGDTTAKLNTRIDNLSVAKGKLPDNMGL